MTRKTLLPLIAVATAAAVVPTTAALAAGSATTPATASSVKIESGYAYYDSYAPLNKRLAVVVVKTHGQLPRRFDGLIRASGSFNAKNGSSIGAVGGKASRCYTFTIPASYLKPGRYAVKLSAKDADGNTVSSTKTINLRERKVGDRSGKPVDC